MEYRVSIADRAERDLAELYTEINAENSEAALRWYRGLRRAILSLQEHPNRCPITRETGAIRHLLYGHKPHVYRVLFRVLERQKSVEVLHIRHAARRGHWERVRA